MKGWDVLDSHVYILPLSSGKRGYGNSRGQSRIRSEQPGAPVLVILWNQRESHLLPNQPAPRRILKLGVPKRKQTRKECELTAFQNGDFLSGWSWTLPRQPVESHTLLVLRTTVFFIDKSCIFLNDTLHVFLSKPQTAILVGMHFGMEGIWKPV